MLEMTPIIGIVINVIVATIVVLLIKYHFSRFKEMEEKVSKTMTEQEVKDLVDYTIDMKLELIRYMLKEIKHDLDVIRDSMIHDR